MEGKIPFLPGETCRRRRRSRQTGQRCPAEPAGVSRGHSTRGGTPRREGPNTKKGERTMSSRDERRQRKIPIGSYRREEVVNPLGTAAPSCSITNTMSLLGRDSPPRHGFYDQGAEASMNHPVDLDGFFHRIERWKTFFYRGSPRCTRMLSSTWRMSSLESTPSEPFSLFLSAVMI